MDWKTCWNCDWWCYGTYPGNTCERWERTVCEVDVPDEVMDAILGGPSAEDMDSLREEIEGIEDGSWGSS